MRSHVERVPIPLAGELDLANAAEVGEALEAAVAQVTGTVVCIDCAQLEFIDSSGLGVLVRFNNAATAAGYEYTVVPGPPQVHRAFVLSGLDQALPFVAGSARS